MIRNPAINLFEYRNKISYADLGLDVNNLESYLEEIWNNRERSDYFRNEFDEEDEDKVEEQRFIQIIKGSSELKSNKYVGVIHFGDHRINLLPKIFYDEKAPNEKDLKSIQLHILWWLSYCDKIKFPTFDSGLSSIDSDFFEILIYIFSKYTRELFSSAIYQQYQEVDRELSFVKGRINTNRYNSENLAKGRWHKINCTYDSFEVDNTFNRVVKYVTKLLIGVSKNQNNLRYLREILFILDDVSDQVMTSRDSAFLQFNPMFTDFEKVRDYCQLFLDHSISFDYKKDLKLFAFLIPMEVLYEDFLTGFIRKELDLNSISAQGAGYNVYLAQSRIEGVVRNHFRLKPDIITKTESCTMIVDAKYKVLDKNSTQSRYGISQSDMYQMVSYAIRLKLNLIILLYPKPIANRERIFDKFDVVDEFVKEVNGKGKIQIVVHEVSIICENLNFSGNVSLSSLFSSQVELLQEELCVTFNTN